VDHSKYQVSPFLCPPLPHFSAHQFMVTNCMCVWFIVFPTVFPGDQEFCVLWSLSIIPRTVFETFQKPQIFTFITSYPLQLLFHFFSARFKQCLYLPIWISSLPPH
jgi:hypothetical protein